ncbi:MAG: transposase [Anaerolineaceae bacterium]|nr:transposase [Anaerolineaceae bacterium]
MTKRFVTIDDRNYPYFATCTIVRWLPIFSESKYAEILTSSLRYIRDEKKTKVNSFVIMPSHIHLIVWPDEKVKITDVLRDFKRFTSKEISNQAGSDHHADWLDLFHSSRLENRSQKTSTYQVWQEGNHIEAIFTEKFAQQKLDYIHRNPIRADLVNTADAWLYSSFLNYEGENKWDFIEVLG